MLNIFKQRIIENSFLIDVLRTESILVLHYRTLLYSDYKGFTLILERIEGVVILTM